MLDLNIRLDRANLRRFHTLAKVSRLMAAKSLTFSAEKGQLAWRAGQTIFHRRNSWIDKGVRIKHATPGNLEARVGTLDKFLGRHIIGIGEQKVGNLFIPNQDADQQPTHTRIRARLRAMARTKTKPFVRDDMLLRRSGKKSDAPLLVLGFLRKKANIKPRLDAVGLVSRTVQVEFPRIYERLLLRWSETGKA